MYESEIHTDTSGITIVVCLEFDRDVFMTISTMSLKCTSGITIFNGRIHVLQNMPKRNKPNKRSPLKLAHPLAQDCSLPF